MMKDACGFAIRALIPKEVSTSRAAGDAGIWLSHATIKGHDP